MKHIIVCLVQDLLVVYAQGAGLAVGEGAERQVLVGDEGDEEGEEGGVVLDVAAVGQ